MHSAGAGCGRHESRCLTGSTGADTGTFSSAIRRPTAALGGTTVAGGKVARGLRSHRGISKTSQQVTHNCGVAHRTLLRKRRPHCMAAAAGKASPPKVTQLRAHSPQ